MIAPFPVGEHTVRFGARFVYPDASIFSFFRSISLLKETNHAVALPLPKVPNWPAKQEEKGQSGGLPDDYIALYDSPQGALRNISVV